MYSNISKYGEALKSLFKQVFNGSVIMEPVDTAFQYAIKQTENDLKLPMISFYPNSTINLDKRNIAMPSYKQGLPYQNPLNIYNENNEYIGTNERLAKNAKFLYIIIGYQIDVWATTRLEVEEVTQELLFWLFENQQLEINYQGNNLAFSFDLADEFIDNSDLVEYQTNGKLYRYTYGIQVHAALLRSENYFTVLKPNIDVRELK